MVNERRMTNRKARFSCLSICGLFRSERASLLLFHCDHLSQPVVDDGVSTGSGSDRVTTLAISTFRSIETRSLSLPILTSSSNRDASFRHQRLVLRNLLCYNHAL